MAKEQKRFLKKVREVWAEEFPFLVPVDLGEVPNEPKGSTYRCDDYFEERGVCYFVSFGFSPVRHGEFMIQITVSPSPDKTFIDPQGDYPPGPTNIGPYNLGWFLDPHQNLLWDLVDVDGKVNAILASLGGGFQFPEYSGPDVWKPSSYVLPFEEITDEAIRDINDRLRRFVFPKLEIAAGTE